MFTLKNCTYLSDEWELKKGDVSVEGEKIVSVGRSSGGEEIDIGDGVLVPGFTDIHIHGANGIDIMTSSPDDIAAMAEYLPAQGVTAFMPTTVSGMKEEILRAVENVREARAKNRMGADIAGVHIEGPFVNLKRKGAFNPKTLRSPDAAEYDRFRKAAGDEMKLRITLAPELPGGLELIRHVRETGGYVTLGHTDATEAVALKGLESGANCFTHLFNAMRGLHQREPGAAGAALLGDSFVELICDGMHVQPDMVKLVFRVKDHGKIALVTDAVLAMGLGDGVYDFCDYKVIVQHGLVREEDGTIAGSTLTMQDAVRNAMRFAGIDLTHAVKCASLVPAQVIGMDGITGSITEGKRADLVVLDKSGFVTRTYCAGKKVYEK